jgi:hypothetical protein
MRHGEIMVTDGGEMRMIEDEHQPYDKSSKWLIQHHGDSMLRLAKIAHIQTWRPAQAEVVQPPAIPRDAENDLNSWKNGC